MSVYIPESMLKGRETIESGTPWMAAQMGVMVRFFLDRLQSFIPSI